MRYATALLAALVLASAPQVARASTILLLRPLVESDVPPSVVATALAAVAPGIARAGYTLVHPRQGSPPPLCQTDRCRVEQAREANADLSLELTFFQDGQSSSATLVLFQPPTHSYYAPLRTLPDSASVERAIETLFADLQRGAGPWLALTGSPSGAEVTIDGEVVGRLPYRAPVSAGEHFIGLQAMGYADYSITTRLDHYANTVVERSIMMQPLTSLGSGAGGPSTRHARNRHFAQQGGWDYVVWGATVGTGLAYAISGFTSLAKDGNCRDREPTYCARYYEYNPVKLWAGVAAVVGGSALIALKPITLSLVPGPERLTSGVLHIKGSF